VAAHNTYWIKFGDLRAQDEVLLETRWGTYRYEVTETRIVQPSDRTILVQTPERRLTLTTCWPLWAGAFAQQRLVIFADQVSPAPPGQRGS
jgi:sortase A